MSFSIATLTLNPALDKSTSVERLVPESKLRCAAVKMDAGGGGINVSKAIRRLGGNSTAIFPSGGHNGSVLTQMLEELGIPTDRVQVKTETRENFSVLETANSAQYRFTMPGGALSAEDAEACLHRIYRLKPQILVASGSLPPGLPVTFYAEVAEVAKKTGARLVLDTSGQALCAAAQIGAYLLKPNLAELSALAGVRQLEMNQVDDAAMLVIAQGMAEIVVVSLGAQGALVATKDGFEHVPAPVVKPKTTVGAGDSMVGGMVWAMGEGRSHTEMAQIGVACGTAATLNEGTELFHAADVWRLLDWIKNYGERYRVRDFS
jgi:6-phosphofructokinase 2